MNKEMPKGKQANMFDKIFKENMELALPGIIEYVLGLHIVHSEEIADELQHTKERKPDVLKKVTDNKNRTFILHIEWQVKNEKDMVYRMAEYMAMLLFKYRLPIKQYVLYIGKGRGTMATSINIENFSFNYHLIALSQIDYQLFLKSKKPEENILAILANFGTTEKQQVAKAIITQLEKFSDNSLAVSKYFTQLRLLAQLRNLPFQLEDMLPSVTTFFKPEKDSYYILGEAKGEALKTHEFVVSLLEKLNLSNEQIADIAGVTVDYVKNVRDSSRK